MTTKKIVLIVAGVVVVLGFLVLVFVGGIVGLALYQVGNSEAALKAKDFLRTSEKLKLDIGEVQDFGSIVTGSIKLESGNGEATLNLKVMGERETVNASVHLILVRGGAWRVSSASYVDASGQTINLLDPYDTKIPNPALIAFDKKGTLTSSLCFLCVSVSSVVFVFPRRITTEDTETQRKHREIGNNRAFCAKHTQMA